MRFADRLIFVTGGAGFIGSAVIRYLLTETAAFVVNIDKLTYAANLNSLSVVSGDPRYRFVKADISDVAAIRGLFETYKPDVVMNLASETHVDRSIEGPADFVQTNVVGTFVLLEESLRFWRTLDKAHQQAFRFLHVSTDEVFGSLGPEGYFNETTRYAPNSPYAASKASSDHFVRAWHSTYGLPTLVSNCTNNYGPYQFPEKLIPHMLIRALSNEPLPVYGDGLNIRDWLHVEDHVSALASIIDRGRPGETYNVGSRSERTNTEVVTTICDILDELRPSPIGRRSDLITFVKDRPGHDRRYAVDPSKLEAELGWRPCRTFSSGVRATVRWYLDNRSWWQAILDRGYTASRLGLIELDSDTND